MTLELWDPIGRTCSNDACSATITAASLKRPFGLLAARRVLSFETDTGLDVRASKPNASLFPQSVYVTKNHSKRPLSWKDSLNNFSFPSTELNWIELQSARWSGIVTVIGVTSWKFDLENDRLLVQNDAVFELRLGEFDLIVAIVEAFDFITFSG